MTIMDGKSQQGKKRKKKMQHEGHYLMVGDVKLRCAGESEELRGCSCEERWSEKWRRNDDDDDSGAAGAEASQSSGKSHGRGGSETVASGMPSPA